MILIGQKELMKRLNVGTVTLWRWRKQGCPCIHRQKFIRYEFEKVIEWLNKDKKVNVG